MKPIQKNKEQQKQEQIENKLHDISPIFSEIIEMRTPKQEGAIFATIVASIWILMTFIIPDGMETSFDFSAKLGIGIGLIGLLVGVNLYYQHKQRNTHYVLTDRFVAILEGIHHTIIPLEKIEDVQLESNAKGAENGRLTIIFRDEQDKRSMHRTVVLKKFRSFSTKIQKQKAIFIKKGIE